jgi:hypothetical protein
MLSSLTLADTRRLCSYWQTKLDSLHFIWVTNGSNTDSSIGNYDIASFDTTFTVTAGNHYLFIWRYWYAGQDTAASHTDIVDLRVAGNASGYAYIDWANIDNKTSTVALTSTTVGSVNSASLSAASRGAIVDEVWDESEAEHTGGGTFGQLANYVEDNVDAILDTLQNQDNWVAQQSTCDSARDTAIAAYGEAASANIYAGIAVDSLRTQDDWVGHQTTLDSLYDSLLIVLDSLETLESWVAHQSSIDSANDTLELYDTRFDSLLAALADGSISDKVWVDGSPTVRGYIDEAISGIDDNPWDAGTRSLTDKAGFSLAADQSGVTIGTVSNVTNLDQQTIINTCGQAAMDSVFGALAADTVGNGLALMTSLFSKIDSAIAALADASIGDKVWTDAGTRTLTDKTGFALSAAGVDAIWDEDSTGHYTSPNMAYVASQTSSLDAATIGIIAESTWCYDISDFSDSADGDSATHAGLYLKVAGDSANAWATGGDLADDILDEPMAGHTTVGTMGKLLNDAEDTLQAIDGWVAHQTTSDSIMDSLITEDNNIGLDLDDYTGTLGSDAFENNFLTESKLADNLLTDAQLDTTFVNEIKDSIWSVLLNSYTGVAGSIADAIYDSLDANISSRGTSDYDQATDSVLLSNIAEIAEEIVDSVWLSILEDHDGTAGSFGDSAQGWGATSASALTKEAIAAEVWTIAGPDDSSYSAGTMGKDAEGWDETAASSLDSAIIARIIKRTVWGIATGSGSDSSSADQRIIDTSIVRALIDDILTDSALAHQTTVDSIYDSVNIVKGIATTGRDNAAKALDSLADVLDSLESHDDWIAHQTTIDSTMDSLQNLNISDTVAMLAALDNNNYFQTTDSALLANRAEIALQFSDTVWEETVVGHTNAGTYGDSLPKAGGSASITTSDKEDIALYVWQADTASHNGTVGSYGEILYKPTFVQGEASGLTATDIWNVPWGTTFDAGSVGDSFKDTTYIRGGGVDSLGVYEAMVQAMSDSSLFSGTGAYTVGVQIVDSASADAPIPGVVVYANNMLESLTNPWEAVTNASGYAIFRLDDSVKFIFNGYGYAAVTDSAYITASDTIIIQTYSSAAGKENIIGYMIKPDGSAYDSALIELTLRADPEDSVIKIGDSLIAPTFFKDTADINGYWSINLFAISNLTTGADTLYYTFRARDKYGNIIPRYRGIKFHVPDVDTTLSWTALTRWH